MKDLYSKTKSEINYCKLPISLPGDGGSALAWAQIPVCNTEKGHIVGIYYPSYDSAELCMNGITDDEFKKYLEMLAGEGFESYAENEINQNLFVTLTGKNSQLHISYYPSFNQNLRTVLTPVRFLPAPSPLPYERLTPTTLNQIVRKGAEQRAPGMSYIVQLADGSFIIIDGGGADESDEAELIKYLEENTPRGSFPTVSAWIITHAHSDHMALANRFIEKYHHRFDLKLAAYNFPTLDTVRWCLDVNGKDSAFTSLVDNFIGGIKKYWQNAKHFVFHSGQRLYIADVTVEVLFTHEDQFPTAMTWINNTSSAFRIISKERTVLFPGDCEKTLCAQIASCYGASLKCDILQVCHHGANGAVLELYRYADPDICLWPCSEALFTTDERMLGTKTGYDFNVFLRDGGIKQRTHRHNSQEAIFTL